MCGLLNNLLNKGGVYFMTIEIHLPDLSFVRKIEESFQINRGIYNTIDAWLFNNGFITITGRRAHILAFLQQITDSSLAEQSRNHLIFPDGLTKALENYKTQIEREAIFA